MFAPFHFPFYFFWGKQELIGRNGTNCILQRLPQKYLKTNVGSESFQRVCLKQCHKIHLKKWCFSGKPFPVLELRFENGLIDVFTAFRIDPRCCYSNISMLHPHIVVMRARHRLQPNRMETILYQLHHGLCWPAVIYWIPFELHWIFRWICLHVFWWETFANRHAQYFSETICLTYHAWSDKCCLGTSCFDLVVVSTGDWEKPPIRDPSGSDRTRQNLHIVSDFFWLDWIRTRHALANYVTTSFSCEHAYWVLRISYVLYVEGCLSASRLALEGPTCSDEPSFNLSLTKLRTSESTESSVDAQNCGSRTPEKSGVWRTRHAEVGV